MGRGPQPTLKSRKAGANMILAEPYDPSCSSAIVRDKLRVVSPASWPPTC
jgi:hypothetical protein